MAFHWYKSPCISLYLDATIITEEWSGTTLDRPNFKKLLKNIKPGDVLVFDEVSRMSCNASEGFELYEELFNKGITLVFLKEPHINTDTYKKALESNINMAGTTLITITRMN